MPWRLRHEERSSEESFRSYTQSARCFRSSTTSFMPTSDTRTTTVCGRSSRVSAGGTVVKGSSSDYAKAAAIERFLSDSAEDAPYQLVVDDPKTGHTVGHLRCFLFDGETCGHQGSNEQFVAAFALLARAVDLPTRIVVGLQGLRHRRRADEPVLAVQRRARDVRNRGSVPPGYGGGLHLRLGPPRADMGRDR